MSTLRSLTTWLIALGMMVFAAPAAAGSPTIRYVDDDGTAGRSGCDGTRAVASRVQRAIDLSRAGDVVKVCPGTYREHLMVGPERLRLVAATRTRPELRPGRSPWSAEALMQIAGRGVLVQGFTFLPDGGGGHCVPVGFVEIFGPATRIVDNVFGAIAPFDSACRRYTTAIAVQTWRPPDVSERVVVRGNVVRDFEQFGVHAVQSFIQVVDNRFVVGRAGDGCCRDVIAAFGVRLNVRDNVVRVHPRDVSVGFLVANLHPESRGDLISGNVAEGVTLGIFVDYGGGNVRIEDNVLLGRSSGPRAWSGIRVGADLTRVSRNVVTGFRGNGIENRAVGTFLEDNDARGNRGTDCRQFPRGRGTWRRNLGTESEPVGLCSRYR